MSPGASSDALSRHERLRGVQVAKAILREGFGLELALIDARGPLAHRRGGVMTGSSEVCRASLFSRDGFGRCDAFYRTLGSRDAPGVERCHLGLLATHVPVVVDGAVLGHLVASGYLRPGGTKTQPPPEPRELAEALFALDPMLPDPSELVRRLPVVAGDRTAIVHAILDAAAREIATCEEDMRGRLREGDDLPGLYGIVGASGPMRALFALMSRVVTSGATVLIQGESGTGKELVARALHDHGPRANGPFVATNCGAVAEDLLDSSLFGHVRGAFSGAVRASTGLFGAADGGTLFLDEIGEMSPRMQVKLLRAVTSDGSYQPVGSTETRRADVRLITASHRDLSEMVAAGTFREDLFYRLHVLGITVPPLRDRPGDLALLLTSFTRQIEDAPTRIGDAARRCLERYAWPGNVRELRAEVERWAVTATGEPEIGPEHLSPPMREAGGYAGASGGEEAAAAAAGTGSLAAAVESLERAIIARGLERTQGNRTQLAKELGISRTTLNDRLKRYDLG